MMALDHVFRLLVPADQDTPQEAPSIKVDGMRWVPTSYTQVPKPENTLAYTCISYSWGMETAPHPFEPRKVSSRAIPALEAVIRSLQPSAIWLDALCVPPDEPGHSACLRSMGAIYARAVQSVAVLSESCRPVLSNIRSRGSVEEGMLQTLDEDGWVTRAWTYQEIANSKQMAFIAEGDREKAIPGDRFLNVVGYALQQLKKKRNVDSFGLRASYMNLDQLEDVLGDWMYTGLGSRFAYQSMAAMDRRLATQSADHFNAMIGTLCTEPPPVPADPALDPSELFMQLCESNGDFSFIYCVGRRNGEPGRRWRPLPGSMRTLLPWHTFGDGQRGSLESDFLRLHEMCAVSPGTLTEDAEQFIGNWLNSDRAGEGVPLSTSNVFARLQSGGLQGHGAAIELGAGYFFPERDIADPSAFAIFVASGVRWVHGAAGLFLRYVANAQRYEFGGVGVFLGVVPKSVESIDIQ